MMTGHKIKKTTAPYDIQAPESPVPEPMFEPGLLRGPVYLTGPMTIKVNHFVMQISNGSVIHVAEREFDISEHVPFRGARWMLVAASKETGAVSLWDGPIVDDINELLVGRMPATGDESLSLAAIRLKARQTCIVRGPRH